MNKESLGDRMKEYENVYRHKLVRRMPVIVRVDGRAFHTFTKGLEKPFDHGLMHAMVVASQALAKDMQGFKLAYIQSDEASFLLTDWDDLNTEAWFDNGLQKIVSISAASMSVHFNRCLQDTPIVSSRTPMFDARAFQVPLDEVANYFLWRAKDWARNSIQMIARAHFSHKQLHGKNTTQIHDMLHKVGVNWTTDYSDQAKNGTWLCKKWIGIDPHKEIRSTSDVLPSFQDVNDLVQSVLPKQIDAQGLTVADL